MLSVVDLDETFKSFLFDIYASEDFGKCFGFNPTGDDAEYQYLGHAHECNPSVYEFNMLIILSCKSFQ